MATTTPNYGWSVPTSSDLVKNGATDIETLGDSVDASLWNSGYGQAGKNKIINADFGVWQRGTSFTINATNIYTADRFLASYSTAAPTTCIVSQQSFTPAELLGNAIEGTFYLRSALTSIGTATDVRLEQRIENVRTFASNTITVSFYAKADAARVVTILPVQNFGSGGSATVNAASSQTVTLTTSWARYSVTFAIASITGKTIGAGSYLGLRLIHPNSNSTIDYWGVQAEYGSKATPFQTASGGSPQAELAMCQRYYYRNNSGGSSTFFAGGIGAYATTNAICSVVLPVPMRVTPTVINTSGTASDYRFYNGLRNLTLSVVPTIGSDSSATAVQLIGTVTTGLIVGDVVSLIGNTSTSAYIGLGAEL
jgi:hypothetical protein